MADLPTAQEAFGDLPTAEEAFGDQPSTLQKIDNVVGSPLKALSSHFTKQGPYTGSLSDYLFSQSSTGRIMSSFAQGAKDQWGALPWYSQVLMQGDAKKSDDSYVKAFNEGIVRPVLSAVDLAAHGGFSLFGGIGGALGQAGTELKTTGDKLGPLGAPLGVTGESMELASTGAIPEGLPEVPAIAEARVQEAAQRLPEARAKAVIGEGEEGYFGVAKPTPEQLEARLQASREAGITSLGQEELPPPNTEELARLVDPKTFDDYDNLINQRDLINKSLKVLQEDKEGLPEVFELKQKEDEILQNVNYNEEDLTEERASELSGIRDQIHHLTIRAKTPEEVELRQNLKDVSTQLADIQGSVNQAYGHAKDLQAAKEAQEASAKEAEAKGVKEGAEAAQPKVVPSGETQPTSKTGLLEPVREATGEEVTSGLSASVSKEAVKSGLDELGDLVTHRKLNLEEDAQRTADYVNSNKEEAIEVAMGTKPVPTGLYPESVYTAVAKLAEASGDFELLRKLGTESAIIPHATELGRRVRILGTLGEDSTVRIITDLKKAREEAVQKKVLETTKKDIDKTVQTSIKQFKADWNSFIKSIECD